MANNSKRYFDIIATNGEQKKQFKLWTSKSAVNRIAEQTAKNLFYNDNIRVLSIV